MGQLPSGAEGTAAGVLLYSVVCLVASSLMIWLTWHHRERNGYVAFLAYFTNLSTLCSIVQQIHGILTWQELVTEQFKHIKENADNPELSISNSAVGLDLVLFYIQFYSYNAEALLVMFWGWALVQSVYKLSDKPKLKKLLKIINRAGLGFSVCFPLITVCSLQAESVRSNSRSFMMLAGQPLLWSIGLGSLALALVFLRYVQSQRRFRRFTMVNLQVSAGSSETQITQRNSMYDRWLIVRFTIAFMVMATFELTITLFSMSSRSRISKETQNTTPDFSPDYARATSLLFMPGVTPSLLLFIIFATTKPCIGYMRSSLGFRRRQVVELGPQSTLSPIRSPIGSTRSCEILKPVNSYQSLVRKSEENYRLHNVKRYAPVQTMNPLPPTPTIQEEYDIYDIEAGYLASPRALKPIRYDLSRL